MAASDHERDVTHHYKFLKQFLDISDDSSSRSKLSSTRALRAKEKLLKLSEAQFRELSTDVYDELRRRIDESRSEPLYLLPRSTFHPKRNQARQKLSSLPQPRFKDLVSDISYEIERRHLSNDLNNASSNPAADTDNSNGSRASHATRTSTSSDALASAPSEASSHPPYPSQLDSSRLSEVSDFSPKQRGISLPFSFDNNLTPVGASSTTVVPTKANLSWSSDEGEPDDDDDDGKLEKVPPKVPSVTLQASTASPRNHDLDPSPNVSQLSFVHPDVNATVLTTADKSVDTISKPTMQSTDSILSLDNDNETIRHLRSRNQQLEADLSALAQERSLLLSQLDSTEKQHKSLKSLIEQELNRLRQENSALQHELMTLKSSHGATVRDRPKSFSTSELDAFVNKLAAPVLIPSHSFENSPAYHKLRSLVETWQGMYQSARSDTIANRISIAALSKDKLGPYVSPHGFLSIRLVSDLLAVIESFIIYLNETEYDVDILFELMSKVCVLGSEVAQQAESHHQVAVENSVSLREMISYSLTSTRYKATYAEAFPTIILERAVGELTFALCNLVALAKLVAGLENDRTNTSQKVPAPVKKPDLALEFGARPLRIADKLWASRNSPETTPIKNEFSRSGTPRSFDPLGSPIIATSALSVTTSAPRTLSSSAGNSTDALRLMGSYGGGGATSADFNRGMAPLHPTSQLLGPSRSPFEYPERDASLPHASSGLKTFTTGRTEPLSLGNMANNSSDESASPPRINLGPMFRASKIVSPGELGDEDNELLASIISNDEANMSSASSNVLESTSINVSLKNATPVAPLPVSGSTNAATTTTTTLNPALYTRENAAPLSHTPHQNKTSANGKADPAPLSQNLAPAVAIQNKASRVTPESSSPEDKSAPALDKQQSSTSKPRVAFALDDDDNDEKLPLQHSQYSLSDSLNDSPKIPSREARGPVKQVSYAPAPIEIAQKQQQFSDESEEEEESDDESEDEQQNQARQRQEHRKSMAAATFNVHLFDIEDPDNTLTQVLLYLEHQTVQVITTIQSLLGAIKIPGVNCGTLREKAHAITIVVMQMTEATNTSMNQTRNAELKQHGGWVVENLIDCSHRMTNLCKASGLADEAFADKNFKQRLAGISFDIAKGTKELVKTVEEASIREDIAYLDARLSQDDDLR